MHSGMNFKDALESLPGDKNICFGSRAAILYFGTAQDCLDTLEERSVIYKKKLESIYRKNIASKGRMKKYSEKDGYIDKNSLKKVTAEECAFIYKKLEAITEKSRQDLESFKKFCDRNVIYSKNRLDGYIIFVLEGNEIGKYWLKSEYDKDVREHDLELKLARIFLTEGVTA